jgi:50S ribosomal subunit-associated GTPase HflX
MSKPHPCFTNGDTPPTPKQMSYLRSLAMQRGETFAVPSTFAQASAEIDRLKGRRRMTRAEHRIDRADRKRDSARVGRDAASVHDSEIEGYGSSATWKVGR